MYFTPYCCLQPMLYVIGHLKDKEVINMSSKFKVVTIILLIIITSFSWAHSIGPIRLAVFDNPKPDPLKPKASRKLKEAYIRGIKTGIYAAKLQGVSIRQKNFFYGHNLLHIFQMVPKVKHWQPDLVVGLHSSNEALMAKTFFDKPLVLSITATESHVGVSRQSV